MCGRYTDTKRDKQFLVRMGIEQAEIEFVPRYNIAPTQEASIIAQGEHGFDLREAYKKRRCLVLGDGFYEWQKVPGGKQPVYIRMHEGRQFAFGGLREQMARR